MCFLFSKLNLSSAAVQAETLTVLIVGVITIFILMGNRGELWFLSIKLSCVDLRAFRDGHFSQFLKKTQVTHPPHFCLFDYRFDIVIDRNQSDWWYSALLFVSVCPLPHRHKASSRGCRGGLVRNTEFQMQHVVMWSEQGPKRGSGWALSTALFTTTGLIQKRQQVSLDQANSRSWPQSDGEVTPHECRVVVRSWLSQQWSNGVDCLVVRNRQAGRKPRLESYANDRGQADWLTRLSTGVADWGG